MFGSIEFRQEDRLILSASNLAMVNNPPADFLARVKNLDWDYIIRHAQFTFFAPPLYLMLKNLRKQQGHERFLPHAPYLKLESAYYAVAASNAELLVQISRISQILEKSGIEAIFLKGAAFLRNIYEDMGIRKTNDIDILVRKEKAKICYRLLVESGYTEDSHDLEKRLHHDKFLFEKELRRPIEVHWGLLHTINEQRKMHIDIEDLFKDSIKINHLENAISVLSAEDSLLYRCIDLAGRHSSVFQCILDISANIRHYKELDWGRFSCKADMWQAKDLVYLGLDFASRRAGVAVPGDIIRNLGSQKAFFYNLRLSDGEIFNRGYNLRRFIEDVLRTLQKNGYKNLISRLKSLPKPLFLPIYLYAAILGFCRFTRRGISDLLESVEITRAPFRSLVNYYWKISDFLKKV